MENETHISSAVWAKTCLFLSEVEGVSSCNSHTATCMLRNNKLHVCCSLLVLVTHAGSSLNVLSLSVKSIICFQFHNTLSEHWPDPGACENFGQSIGLTDTHTPHSTYRNLSWSSQLAMLSERMKRRMAGEPSLLFKGFIAAKNNPYSADTNPTGIINLGKQSLHDSFP